MRFDGRYAPSPSGDLHLGNLRTALLAWLFARSRGARFLLRIDDLDPARSRPEHEERQLADLAALGIDWDGEPVRQSEQRPRHELALATLEASGATYPCWCTRAEIRAAAEAPHGHLPEGAYPGTCRNLSATERDEREHSGRPAALRLAAGGEQIEFEDLLHGPVSGAVDDFVLRRGDGTPAYHLATVVDDAEAGVGEVVRGEDLLESTPRQIVLQRHLGLEQPGYAHVPLVLGPDGERLAKRHGAVTLAEYPGGAGGALGWMAQSLRLPASKPKTAGDLLEGFDPVEIPREPTVLRR